MNQFGEVYMDSYEVVPVDNVGVYSGPAGMSELCYCAGVCSTDGENVYAAHVSPGHPGMTPESAIGEFENIDEGSELYAVLGVNVDSEVEDAVLDMDPDYVFNGRNFVFTPENAVFSGRKEKRNPSPIL